MRALAFVIAFGTAVLSLTAACAHRRELRSSAPMADLERLNAEIGGRRAELTLRDGFIVTGCLLEIGPDSIWLGANATRSVAEDGRASRSLARSELRRLRVLHRGRGASDGGKIGVIAGGIAGFALGAAASTADLCLENCDRRPATLGRAVRGGLVGAFVLGALGYPIGALIGAAAGSTIRVEIGEEPARGAEPSGAVVPSSP